MSYDGTKGERRIRALAKDKGLHLYRGDEFGCKPIWTGQPGDYEKARQPYSILDMGRPGDYMDDKLVLCRITLDQAERYLTIDEIPEGHTLNEPRTGSACSLT